MRATQEMLQELHIMLAETLHSYMVNTPIHKRRASYLNVIRMFLQDNGIEHADTVAALEALATPREDHTDDQPLADLNGLSVPF